MPLHPEDPPHDGPESTVVEEEKIKKEKKEKDVKK